MDKKTIEILDGYAPSTNSPGVSVEKTKIKRILEGGVSHPVVVLKPHIDWMTLTFSGEGVFGLTKAYQAHSYWKEAKSLLLELVKGEGWLEHHDKRYWLCVDLPLGQNRTARLSLDPKQNNSPAARLEFNPSNWTKTTVNKLASVWEHILGDDLPLPVFMNTARISRVDIAIDILNLQLADLFVFNAQTWKVWICCSPNGGAQTFNFYQSKKGGSPFISPKKRANLIAYDKREQLIAKGIKPPYGSLGHIRIEACKTGSLFLRNLPKMNFPFEGWQFRRAINCNPPMDPATWKLFLDSIRLRGYANAKALLPEGADATIEPVSLAQFPNDLILKTDWNDWPGIVSASPIKLLVEWAKHKPEIIIPAGILKT